MSVRYPGEAAGIIAALKAAETPLGDMAGLVERLRSWGEVVRMWSERGTQAQFPADAMIQAADAITALTRQLGEAQQWAKNQHATADRYAAELAERDAEVKRLRAVVVRYGDRIRMAMAPAELQQTIDEALGGDNG